MEKAILYLESEIELVKLIIGQARQLIPNDTAPYKSKIYFIPKPKEGLGIIGLAEAALCLKLSGEFIDDQGKNVSLTLMRETLECAFNFEFKDFDRKIYEIFRRKSFNLTKALDYLKNLLTRESRRREKQKMKNNAFVDR